MEVVNTPWMISQCPISKDGRLLHLVISGKNVVKEVLYKLSGARVV